MKIYNKRAFIWGVLWTILGVLRLILLVAHPEDGVGDVVKGVFVSGVLLILGASGFVRACSATVDVEEEKVNNDESV